MNMSARTHLILVHGVGQASSSDGATVGVWMPHNNLKMS